VIKNVDVGLFLNEVTKDAEIYKTFPISAHNGFLSNKLNEIKQRPGIRLPVRSVGFGL